MMKLLFVALLGSVASAMTLATAQAEINKYDTNGDGDLEWREYRRLVSVHMNNQRLTTQQWQMIHA